MLHHQEAGWGWGWGWGWGPGLASAPPIIPRLRIRKTARKGIKRPIILLATGHLFVLQSIYTLTYHVACYYSILFSTKTILKNNFYDLTDVNHIFQSSFYYMSKIQFSSSIFFHPSPALFQPQAQAFYCDE